jgi:chromosome segregation ATPase
MDNRDSAQIGTRIDELEKELKTSIHHLGIVQEQIHKLQRDKLQIQVKIKDMQIVLDKAKYNKAELEAELRIERSNFWNAKNSGL